MHYYDGIAGASALFVSTDTSFKENPLKNIFGINESSAHDKHRENVLTAGASTVTGFIAAQTAQNGVLSIWDKRKKNPSNELIKQNNSKNRDFKNHIKQSQ